MGQGLVNSLAAGAYASMGTLTAGLLIYVGKNTPVREFLSRAETWDIIGTTGLAVATAKAIYDIVHEKPGRS
jgi:hypothetical protein